MKLKGITSAANIITSIRIVCSVAILFCQALSIPFYVLYIIAGFTDMVDGTVARKMGTVSDFGSKLDTVADFVFVAACLIKLIPVLNIDKWIYIWIVIIALIKVINIATGFAMQQKLVAVHSIMNKLTGGLLFVFPLTVSFIEVKYSAIVVCLVATFAAIQEGHFIRSGREQY